MRTLFPSSVLRFTLWFILPLEFCLEGRTFVVSPTGNDANRGTFQEPIRSISSGARRAKPGDMIYVLEGTYRERIAPARGGQKGRPITYRAEPGKRVYVKGSEIWKPKWKITNNGIHFASPDPSLFDDRSPEYSDHHNPFKVQLASTPYQREGQPEYLRKQEGEQRIGNADNKVAYTCGQIFVEGKPYLEVPLKEELTPKTWFFDNSENNLYVHFGTQNPNELEVEITTRRRIFAPTLKGLGHIIVEGFIFEHCGNQYPTDFWKLDKNAQKGAVGTQAGHHWIIRRNLIRYAKTFAIDCGRVDRHTLTHSTSYNNTIEENYIIENGSAGILSYGSRNLVIRNNVILSNNQLFFSGIKRWEQAGVKCHKMENGLIEKNYIALNHHSPGIWLDNEFPNSRISRNVIHDNGTHGLFLEMSDYDYDNLFVHQNLIFNNVENAVYIHDASGATFTNNLLASSSTPTSRAILIKQVSKRSSSRNHSFLNNLIIGDAPNTEVNYPAFRSGPQKFDYNLYGVSTSSRNFIINAFSDQPTPWGRERFKEQISADFKENQSAIVVNHDRHAVFDYNAWKYFWKKHQMENERNSEFIPNLWIEHFPHEQEIVIKSHKMEGIPLSNHQKKDPIFLFEQLKDSQQEKPSGPFRIPMLSPIRLKIWDGLSILKKGALPKVGWTLTAEER